MSDDTTDGTSEESPAGNAGSVTGGTEDTMSSLEELRAENERLRAALETTSQESSEESEADHAQKVRTRRRRASIGLAVVLALLLPPAVATVWVRNRMLDTDTYV